MNLLSETNKYGIIRKRYSSSKFDSEANCIRILEDIGNTLNIKSIGVEQDMDENVYGKRMEFGSIQGFISESKKNRWDIYKIRAEFGNLFCCTFFFESGSNTLLLVGDEEEVGHMEKAIKKALWKMKN